MDGRRVTIVGKHWTLRYVPLRKIDGDCDAPTTPGKEIRVARRLLHRDRQQRLMETLVHECLHAANWNLSEEHVTQASSDITNVLWASGFRHQDHISRRKNGKSRKS